jgi:hypothetical protein
MRRYSRIAGSLLEVRYQKDVVTFPVWQRPKNANEIHDAGQVIAEMAMIWYDVPAAKIVTHYLGEVSQGVHFELITPDDGRPRPPHELPEFAAWIGWGLNLDTNPVIYHSFISQDSLSAEEQQKRWWHGLRYAAHPTGYVERWPEMSDEELKALLTSIRGTHAVRGFGLWSNRLIHSKAADDLRMKYSINLGDLLGKSDVLAIGRVCDGGECPKCKAMIEVKRHPKTRRPIAARIPLDCNEELPGVWVSPDIPGSREME